MQRAMFLHQARDGIPDPDADPRRDRVACGPDPKSRERPDFLTAFPPRPYIRRVRAV